MLSLCRVNIHCLFRIRSLCSNLLVLVAASGYQRRGPSHRVLSPVFSLLMQEVIDIFEGVRDDQALRMASNLGFKGPLERQVMQFAGSFHSPDAEEQAHEFMLEHVGHAHKRLRRGSWRFGFGCS